MSQNYMDILFWYSWLNDFNFPTVYESTLLNFLIPGQKSCPGMQPGICHTWAIPINLLRYLSL